MAIGMTPDEFWHGPTDLCKAYREAWEIRRDSRYASEWRIGAYVKRAFEVVLDHAVNRNAKSEYPDAPLLSSTEEREKVERARERERMRRNRQALEERVAKINERFAAQERQGEQGA